MKENIKDSDYVINESGDKTVVKQYGHIIFESADGDQVEIADFIRNHSTKVNCVAKVYLQNEKAITALPNFDFKKNPKEAKKDNLIEKYMDVMKTGIM